VDVIVAPRPSAHPRTLARHRIGATRGATAVATAGAALVIAVWWDAAPPALGRGAGLMDAGRLVGFLAGYVAVLQLLLRARLGVIERTLGTDAINTAHRILGCYLLALILSHASLITAGYAASGRTSLGSQLRSLLTDYPYVLWAVIAAGLLIGVGLTSVPRVRHLMPYEVWHGAHLAVYLALALSFFHQIADGEHFRHTAWLRTSWIVVWIGVAVMLLWSRWLRPVVLALRHRLVVAEVRRDTPRTVTIAIAGRRLDRFPATAGQYFRWRFLTARRWHVAHPYSLSAEPDGHRLRITATTTGRYSCELPDLPVGIRVVAEGPCGGLIATRRWRGPVLLIAGGVGITPIRTLFATVPSNSLTLIYRGHSTDDMPLSEDLDDIAERRHADVHYLVGSRNDPTNALSAQRLATLCPDVHHAQVYICGSASFVRYVHASLAALGVCDRHIRTESFELA